jgi:hypothetical protein
VRTHSRRHVECTGSLVMWALGGVYRYHLKEIRSDILEPRCVGVYGIFTSGDVVVF